MDIYKIKHQNEVNEPVTSKKAYIKQNSNKKGKTVP